MKKDRTITSFWKINGICWKKNFEPLSPQNALCQVCLKLAQGFGNVYWISALYFRYYVIISPSKRTLLLIWQHSTFLFTQRCFVSILVEFCPMFLERKISKFRQCYFPISSLSLFVKVRGPSFERTLILFTQRCSAPSFVKSAQWFWRRF